MHPYCLLHHIVVAGIMLKWIIGKLNSV